MARKELALPASLYSSDRVLEAAEELHHYGTELTARQRQASKPAAKLSELSPGAAALLAALPAERQAEPAAIEALRQELEAFTQSAAVVALTLATMPSSGLKEELVSWLRTEVRPNVLVSFHVNPDIAGGIVIRAGSSLYDHSFRTALLDHPERFTKELEHVR